MNCCPKRKCSNKPPVCEIHPKCKITYQPKIPSIHNLIKNPYIKQLNKKGQLQSNIYSNTIYSYPKNYKCNGNTDIYRLSNKCKLPKKHQYKRAHAMPSRLSFATHYPWTSW